MCCSCMPGASSKLQPADDTCLLGAGRTRESGASTGPESELVWFKVLSNNMSRHTIVGNFGDALAQIDCIAQKQYVQRVRTSSRS